MCGDYYFLVLWDGFSLIWAAKLFSELVPKIRLELVPSLTVFFKQFITANWLFWLKWMFKFYFYKCFCIIAMPTRELKNTTIWVWYIYYFLKLSLRLIVLLNTSFFSVLSLSKQKKPFLINWYLSGSVKLMLSSINALFKIVSEFGLNA